MARAIFLRPADQLSSGATLSMGLGSLASGYALTALHNGNPAAGILLAAATSFYVVLDFGSAKALRAFHFFGHNWDPSLSIFINAHTSNSWGAPDFSSSVTVPADTADGYGQDFVWTGNSGVVSKRYWRFGCSSTNSAAWRLGELVVTDNVSRDLPFENYQPTLAMSDVRIGGVEHVTPSGVSLRYQAPSRVVTLSGEIKGTRAELLEVRDWLRACGGRGTPTAFILEDDDSNKECFFVVPEGNDFNFQHLAGGIWHATLSLRTLSNGVPA